MLRVASAMHDVGKIGVPDRVLLKRGTLDKHERDTMEAHATIGAEILAGSSSPLIRMSETIARTHHERWDGSGYPQGLKGLDIPLVGRICAVCDVFDALLSERPYKPAWTLLNAAAELRRVSGSHLDARLVEVFLALVPELIDQGLTRAYPGASPDGHGEAAQSDDAETYDPAPHDAVHDGPVLDEEPRPIAAVCRAESGARGSEADRELHPV